MAVDKKSPSRSKADKGKEHTSENKVSNPKSVARADTIQHEKRNTMSDEVKSIIEYEDDLDAAEAPALLPKGDYMAEIRGAEKKESKNPNDKGVHTEYVNVTFYISPDSYPADFAEGDPDGVILSYGRLNPANTVKARFGMKKFCEKIGAPLGKKLDLNDWIGKSAIVTIGHEPWDGMDQMRITGIKGAA